MVTYDATEQLRETKTMNLLTRIREKVAPSKLAAQFDQTLSVKIGCGDRVRRRSDGRLGTVVMTGMVDGTVMVPALTVAHDDGTEAFMAPAEEYTKATKY